MSFDFFERRNGTLHAEEVPLARIATEFGTPVYVYSKAALTHAWNELPPGWLAAMRLCATR